MGKNKGGNKNNNNNNNKRSQIHDFLEVCKPKKLKPNELAELISEYQRDIIGYVISKGHLYSNVKDVADTFNDLYDKMTKENFIKALKYMRKNDDMELDYGFVIVITGFIERNHKNENVSADVIEKYSNLISKLLKKRIKNIQEDGIELDSDILTELLVITPSPEYISNEKFVGVYVFKMLRKLYILSESKDIEFKNTKQTKKLFKNLFGKKLIDIIAVNILLEKKESVRNLSEKSKTVWNAMTNFALDVINDEKKDHIIELIKYYCDRRMNDAKNQRDGARRIQLASVDAETYPAIAKIAGKMAKDEDYSKYL